MKRIFFILLGIHCYSLPMLFAQKQSQYFTDFVNNKNTCLLQDFSYAGYAYGEREIPIRTKMINVSEHGILPNTNTDLTPKIQNLIDNVGLSGGGVIYFPKGKYCLNMDSTQVQFLKIDYSNIVLKGAGSGDDGTIFYCGAETLQENINPWLSPFLIRFGHKIQSTEKFWGALPLDYKKTSSRSGSAADPGSDGDIDEAKILTSIVKEAKRGDYRLYLNNTKGINKGDVILLVMYNSTDDGDLIQELLGYTASDITPDLISARRAGPERVASFQWLVEVDKVEKKNAIILKQPLKCDIKLKYKPEIAEAPMLKEVGIENIRFETAWNGIYLHHGGGKHSPRVSKIMDYGWNAVNFCRVSHGWMRNVVIKDYTNPIYLQDSRNVTIENVTIEGYNGHCGIKVYAHAADNLIRNIQFNCNFTHMLSGEGNAYGNVFQNINYNYRNNVTGQYDFHGFADATYSPPAWNLFEQIDGLSTIDGGGATYNFPHTAKENVWWNCTAKGINKPTELFNHWVWWKMKRTDHHKMYPCSIIVGYNAENDSWLIDENNDDRNESLLHVESLNKGPVYPLSLYEEQKKIRIQSSK